MSGTHYSCLILMKLEFPQQIFENYSNIKFHENSSNGNRVFFPADGKTDGQNRHDEADNGISQLCESA
jgi:hypothetical protein